MPEDVVRFNQAKDEEKGSFSNRETGRSYDNMSNDTACDREESAMRSGADAVSSGDLPSDSDSSTRWNVTSSQVDSQSHEYPTRLNPGG
ncbi:MAG: hypothetical protein H7Z11_15765 [Verrucomicrobia bacterium]|nr:hypothetical protein [Leptolyngbya sp. ES-bin-22]